MQKGPSRWPGLPVGRRWNCFGHLISTPFIPKIMGLCAVRNGWAPSTAVLPRIMGIIRTSAPMHASTWDMPFPENPRGQTAPAGSSVCLQQHLSDRFILVPDPGSPLEIPLLLFDTPYNLRPFKRTRRHPLHGGSIERNDSRTGEGEWEKRSRKKISAG
jgi:hypothetical protein